MPVGQVPAPGNLSFDDLANELSYQEQVNFTRLTGLVADSNSADENLANFVQRPVPIGCLAIVPTGASSSGTVFISNSTIYISGTKTAVDVCRLSE